MIYLGGAQLCLTEVQGSLSMSYRDPWSGSSSYPSPHVQAHLPIDVR